MNFQPENGESETPVKKKKIKAEAVEPMDDVEAPAAEEVATPAKKKKKRKSEAMETEPAEEAPEAAPETPVTEKKKKKKKAE